MIAEGRREITRRRWLVAAGLLALSTSSTRADDATSGPRPGKYRISSYGATNRPPLHLGHFVLGAGTYTAYLPGDKIQGDGRYTYDATSRTVTWTSGPYAGTWGGAFTVERDGKTYKIRLESTTIATNNSDDR